jgi:hypothetical protein
LNQHAHATNTGTSAQTQGARHHHR